MKKYTILILLICLFAACKKQIGEYTPQQGPIAVEVMVIDASAINGIQHSYMGSIIARDEVNLSFSLGGEITLLNVQAGDRVKTGQLLAQVDDSSVRSTFEAAEATLNQAKDGYERAKKVYLEGGISEAKWKDIETQVAKAQSVYNVAKKRVDDCTITALFDGVISECNVHKGQNLLPGQTVVTLVSADKLSASFSVPETEISNISIGKDVNVIVSANNNQLLKGRISEKNSHASPLSHSYLVKAELSGSTKGCVPGMICKVETSSSSKRNVSPSTSATETANEVVIPAACIQTRPEGHAVWVMRDGKASRQPVTTGGFVKNGVIITDGLQNGDSLIIEGYQKLINGMSIAASCK